MATHPSLKPFAATIGLKSVIAVEDTSCMETLEVSVYQKRER